MVLLAIKNPFFVRYFVMLLIYYKSVSIEVVIKTQHKPETSLD